MAALTVSNYWQHALAFLKLPSTAFTSEEVRCANEVQSIISGYYTWHWLLTAGTNIAITLASGQDYNMAAGDQNKVQAIGDANLLSGSTQLPQLQRDSGKILPKESSTSQPTAVCIMSPTAIRLWPAPDASYTFQWRYYAKPVVFTANSENYQCPDSQGEVIKEGNIWKVFHLLDDDREKEQYEKFTGLLANLKRVEETTIGRAL